MKQTIFAALLILSLSQISFSQRGFVATLGGGISIPTSESAFTNAFGKGFNLNGSAGYVIKNNIIVRSELTYNRFPFEENDPFSSGGFTVMTLKAELLAGRFTPGESFQPYGVIGMGPYFMTSDYTENNITVSASNTEFGLGLGGGFIYQVGPKLGIFVESQYNMIFNDGSAKAFVPIKAGVFLDP